MQSQSAGCKTVDEEKSAGIQEIQPQNPPCKEAVFTIFSQIKVNKITTEPYGKTSNNLLELSYVPTAHLHNHEDRLLMTYSIGENKLAKTPCTSKNWDFFLIRPQLVIDNPAL